MTLTWLGHSCFKIQDKEATIVTDPFNASIGLKVPRIEADLVTISHDHSDHNNFEAIKGNPFVIKGPGEYEVKNILVYGLSSFHDKVSGQERGTNTIYLIKVDDLNIAHLGDFGQTSLSDEQMEKLEGVDILLIPVGGTYTVNSKEAVEIINQIEPRIVIPMHYKVPGLKINLESVDKFCKEIGVCRREATEKLKLTKKDLPQEEMEAIVMKL